MNERLIFSILKERINSIQIRKGKIVLVAVNGIEGTGKTFFSKNLVSYLIDQKIAAFHISIDGFHFNKERRYKQGIDSARGYYEDSHDEQTFINDVLKSSQHIHPTIIRASHDLQTDKYIDAIPESISNNSVIVSDGAYLFKPLMREHWDLKVYLKTDFATAMKRGIERDIVHLKGYELSKTRYETRYHAASNIYMAENTPEDIADIILDNTDFSSLKITKIWAK